MSLRVDNVNLVLGDGEEQIKVLDDVCLEVANGEFLAVMGPSGAGKSSLLAVCGGLRRPTSGRVFVGDEELTALGNAAMSTVRRTRIGFVFQQSNLVPSLSALDQLLLLVHVRGARPGSGDRDRARALLEEVGMAEKSNRRPDQLSGGEKQRVGIARALMGEPAVLLVDEPTSMLDQARGHQIVELLQRQCHEHKVATVMVTHDRSVLDTADRVVHIVDGRIETTEPMGRVANA